MNETNNDSTLVPKSQAIEGQVIQYVIDDPYEGRVAKGVLKAVLTVKQIGVIWELLADGKDSSIDLVELLHSHEQLRSQWGQLSGQLAQQWCGVHYDGDSIRTKDYYCKLCKGIVYTHNLPPGSSIADAWDAVPHVLGCVVSR